MATVLNKDLVRESTVVIDDKPVVVTLMADQSISMKLKGVRGGESLTIELSELWEYLGGKSPSKGGSVSTQRQAPKKGDNRTISLYDLRSANAISELSHADVAKFDALISDMIRNLK